jgi:hypothetical protein
MINPTTLSFAALGVAATATLSSAALMANGADDFYDAGSLMTGDASWADTGPASGQNLAFSAQGGAGIYTVTTLDPSPASAIDSAVVFDGSYYARNDAGLSSFGNDASVEVFFRPSDFDGLETLFESGGSGTGTGIGLTGSTLRAGVTNGSIDFDLASIGLAEFIQVVLVKTSSDATLYVNGSPVGSTAATGGFAGADRTGIADANSGIKAPTPNGPFTGEIAAVRLYDAPISAADVQASFNAVFIPEPTSALAGVAGLGLLGMRRRK